MVSLAAPLHYNDHVTTMLCCCTMLVRCWAARRWLFVIRTSAMAGYHVLRLYSSWCQVSVSSTWICIVLFDIDLGNSSFCTAYARCHCFLRSPFIQFFIPLSGYVVLLYVVLMLLMVIRVHPYLYSSLLFGNLFVFFMFGDDTTIPYETRMIVLTVLAVVCGVGRWRWWSSGTR